MVITLHSLVKVQKHVRSNNDRRVYVDRYIYSYYADNGDEHRKAYEVKCNTVCIPQQSIILPLPKAKQ